MLPTIDLDAAVRNIEFFDPGGNDVLSVPKISKRGALLF
jgi:hypothetical protein